MERLLESTLLVKRSVALLAGAGVCCYSFSVRLPFVASSNSFSRNFNLLNVFPLCF